MGPPWSRRGRADEKAGKVDETAKNKKKKLFVLMYILQAAPPELHPRLFVGAVVVFSEAGPGDFTPSVAASWGRVPQRSSACELRKGASEGGRICTHTHKCAARWIGQLGARSPWHPFSGHMRSPSVAHFLSAVVPAHFGRGNQR